MRNGVAYEKLLLLDRKNDFYIRESRSKIEWSRWFSHNDDLVGNSVCLHVDECIGSCIKDIELNW